MMTYTAPDGHIIESEPYPQIVRYECACSEIVDGVYTSVETTGAATDIGIQQIKIKRIVDNNYMKIEVQMSSDAELIKYIEDNTPSEITY
jgi:DNA-directed RNA polymerase subunit E'/Rpb7